MSERFLRDLPEIDLVFPSTPGLEDVVEFLRNETFHGAVKHCVRCAYFTVIIGKKHPAFAGLTLDMESVLLGFEGANAARYFLQNHAEAPKWDKHRIQLVWDSIALQTTRSIAIRKQSEVHLMTLTIVEAFPRGDLMERGKKVMCGFCRDKPETTYDNLVGGFGLRFGYDGKGEGNDEYAKAHEEHSRLMGPLFAVWDEFSKYEE
ncbi:hypothetical protein ABOM_000058 [Aspergillus bombycis]|uniref:Uncharacterized protein n=1 Tax=Aspergillus bombycis TaxID=109264 RepID=A0A1F8AGW8_9EURO|nr:hypothetical protein ABOM_000058 [Aspergillus bombycis]OGM51000.1 hypothetical protein ABOM_000058 [Aspergillus bombycis]